MPPASTKMASAPSLSAMAVPLSCPKREHVAAGAVSPVEIYRRGLVQTLHDLGYRDSLCLDQQRYVVTRENAGEDAAAGAVLVSGEGKEVLLEISGILVRALILIAPDDGVIEGARMLGAGHEATIADGAEDVNIPAFTV